MEAELGVTAGVVVGHRLRVRVPVLLRLRRASSNRPAMTSWSAADMAAALSGAAPLPDDPRSRQGNFHVTEPRYNASAACAGRAWLTRDQNLQAWNSETTCGRWYWRLYQATDCAHCLLAPYVSLRHVCQNRVVEHRTSSTRPMRSRLSRRRRSDGSAKAPRKLKARRRRGGDRLRMFTAHSRACIQGVD